MNSPLLLSLGLLHELAGSESTSSFAKQTAQGDLLYIRIRVLAGQVNAGV